VEGRIKRVTNEAHAVKRICRQCALASSEGFEIVTDLATAIEDDAIDPWQFLDDAYRDFLSTIGAFIQTASV
jgi:hypothetical protein